VTKRILVCAAALTAIALPVHAQGNLSSQGFGYPPGQLSTRALSTGGGVSLFDPQSPLNPAAISASANPALFLQYEPEFRTVSGAGATDRARLSRFPVVVAVLPIGSRAALGLSMSTLLDRTWATRTTRDETIADETVTLTETVKSTGAINDLQVAGGWAPTSWIQFGLAGHVIAGQNRVDFVQSFPDTTKFSAIAQRSTLGYDGYAVSGGLVIRPAKSLVLAAAGRKGSDIHARSEDTLVSSAKVPDRLAAGLSFEGIPGATISANVARDLWSSMNGLGTDAARAVDTWDTGVGIEAVGPRIIERVIILRLGGRYRTLPFLAGGQEVRELSFAGGIGAQFTRNRAGVDFAVRYATRKAASGGALDDMRERGLTLSFGLRVRP
jgi:hypothetical protein